jgi:hypothetical protein
MSRAAPYRGANRASVCWCVLPADGETFWLHGSDLSEKGTRDPETKLTPDLSQDTGEGQISDMCGVTAAAPCCFGITLSHRTLTSPVQGTCWIGALSTRAVLRICLFSVLLCIGLLGCAGVGPARLSDDQLHYSNAISDAQKRQIPLNIV